MARIVFDGNYTVHFLAVKPANPAAPTVAEITAGVDLTPFIPKDGFNPAVTNSRVTGGDLSTKFKDESMGTYTSQLAIDGYLDDGTDGGANTAWTTLAAGATGCIVVTPFGPAAASSEAYVWPDVECGQPVVQKTGENTRQKFQAELAVRAEPVWDAVVAA